MTFIPTPPPPLVGWKLPEETGVMPPKVELPVTLQPDQLASLAEDIVYEMFTDDQIADTYEITVAQLHHLQDTNVVLKRQIEGLRQSIESGALDDPLVHGAKSVLKKAYPVIAQNIVSADQDPAVTARTVNYLSAFILNKERNSIVAQDKNARADGAGLVSVSMNVSTGIRGISDATIEVTASPAPAVPDFIEGELIGQEKYDEPE